MRHGRLTLDSDVETTDFLQICVVQADDAEPELSPIAGLLVDYRHGAGELARHKLRIVLTENNRIIDLRAETRVTANFNQ